jgi:hypothetical protein
MGERASERRKERRQISVVSQEAPTEITRSMVTLNCGDRKCSDFKNLRADTIVTMVFPKGYMVIGGELRGEK